MARNSSGQDRGFELRAPYSIERTELSECLKQRVDVAIFLRNLAGGGVERMRLHLAENFVARNLRIELVVGLLTGDRVDEIPSAVNVVELARSALPRARFAAAMADPGGLAVMARPVLLARKPPPTLTLLPSLAHYLRSHWPRSLFGSDPVRQP